MGPGSAEEVQLITMASNRASVDPAHAEQERLLQAGSHDSGGEEEELLMRGVNEPDTSSAAEQDGVLLEQVPQQRKGWFHVASGFFSKHLNFSRDQSYEQLQEGDPPDSAADRRHATEGLGDASSSERFNFMQFIRFCGSG
jgi:hypothetical protein